MSASEMTVAVATYNLCSSALGDTTQYPLCDPVACSVEHRRNLITKKIEGEMARSRIICLQEVCTEWLFTVQQCAREYFYNVVHVLYGPERNGRMGVAIAYPMSLYYRTEEHIVHPLETYKGQFEESVDWTDGPLKIACEKNNALVALLLEERASGMTFVVATYHVPVATKMRSIMMLHTIEALLEAHKFAGGRPLILAGDFNTLPGDPEYTLVTKGTTDPADAEKWGAEMKLQSGCFVFSDPKRFRLTSAYNALHGAEPAYTNHACSSWRGKPADWFTGTIDYIFMSPHWRCIATNDMPNTKPGEKDPMPTLTEPSDHLLLSAVLVLEEYLDNAVCP